MDWERSRARRVCEAVFGGDVFAMRKYGRDYLDSQGKGMEPLGRVFRDIVGTKPRLAFWQRAMRHVDEHVAALQLPDDASIVAKRLLPVWCESAGGRPFWEKWVRREATRCAARASRCQSSNSGSLAGTKGEWEAAVRLAVWRCGGRGRYSRLPLTLAANEPTGNPTSPRYPSIDHTTTTTTSDWSVEVECRIVNDMKSLLSLKEFRELIAHLASTLRLQPTPLGAEWRPQRDFARAAN